MKEVEDCKTLPDKVEYILETELKSRNSDIILTKYLWMTFYVSTLNPLSNSNLDPLFKLPQQGDTFPQRPAWKGQTAYIPEPAGCFRFWSKTHEKTAAAHRLTQADLRGDESRFRTPEERR